VEARKYRSSNTYQMVREPAKSEHTSANDSFERTSAKVPSGTCDPGRFHSFQVPANAPKCADVPTEVAGRSGPVRLRQSWVSTTARCEGFGRFFGVIRSATNRSVASSSASSGLRQQA